MKKLLQKLEMKLIRYTSYPSTYREIFFHIFKHYLYPFKLKGWFGFCTECNNFKFRLKRRIIDADYEQDEDGLHTYPIHGMVCKKCAYILDVEEENQVGRYAI